MRQLYFAFLLCSLLVDAQNIKITDANFERALIEQGYDFGNPDGFVSRDDVSTITYLNISGQNIQDLSGLEAFESLQTLIADNNAIENLDLSGNTLLKEVSIYNNNLVSIDVSSNARLEKLNTFKNNLGYIDLTNNRNLTYLAVADNNLTELDLYNNKQLQTLYCQDNQLNTLVLSNTPELKIVNCEYNNIVSLELQNDAKLEMLNASNNNIKNLDLSTNVALTQVNVMYNAITELDLSANSALNAILVGYNNLTSLNIRNGNNDNIQIFRSEGNEGLECITADNSIAESNAENAMGRWNKDYNTGFSANCKALQKNNIVAKSFSFFIGQDKTLTVNSTQKASLQILNLQGVAVISESLEEGLNAISLTNALSDVYVLQINSEYGTYTKKFILN